MILGIDLGSKTGWSLIKEGKRISSGTEKLQGKELADRFLYSQEFFGSLIENPGLEAVYFEHVRRFMSSQAALVYCGLLAILMCQCQNRGIPFISLSPTEIKKYATGSGKASKEEMTEAATNLTGHKPIDDNEADAIIIGLLGYNQFSKH